MNTLYLKLAVGIVAVLLLAWYRHQLIEEGKESVRLKDNELVIAQAKLNYEVERHAIKITAEQVGKLKAQLDAKPTADAPSLKCVGMRNTAANSRTVRKDAGARSTIDGATEQPAVVPRVDPEPIDYGPLIYKRLSDDDAIILALQQRIAAEVGICR